MSNSLLHAVAVVAFSTAGTSACFSKPVTAKPTSDVSGPSAFVSVGPVDCSRRFGSRCFCSFRLSTDRGRCSIEETWESVGAGVKSESSGDATHGEFSITISEPCFGAGCTRNVLIEPGEEGKVCGERIRCQVSTRAVDAGAAR